MSSTLTEEETEVQAVTQLAKDTVFAKNQPPLSHSPPADAHFQTLCPSPILTVPWKVLPPVSYILYEFLSSGKF